MDKVEDFIGMLAAAPHADSVFNPWAEYSPALDIGPEAASLRINNLRAYLAHRITSTRLLFIAEAPGYQGCRFSGIPMTCERTLLGGKAGISPDLVFPATEPKLRTSSPTGAGSRTQREFGYAEPTATYVWGELARRPEAARQVVLWNTFPFHPHNPGAPLTNRRPKPAEVARYFDITMAMVAMFPDAQVVAIGEVAKQHLAAAGVAAIGARHPSYGGAPEFLATVRPLLDSLP